MELSPEAASAVDAVFSELREKWRIPGVAYGVIDRDGRLVHSGGCGARGVTPEGTADATAGGPPGPETVFRIASMTKSVTAACALSLRDEGRLDLDEPVASLVPSLAPGLRPPTADSPPITVRMLLSMASGLMEDDPWGDRMLDMDPEHFPTLVAGGLGFDRPPGTRFEYSNLGFAIVGRVIATVAGEALRSFSARRLFEPLGLADTTWDADRIPASFLAPGFRLESGHFVVEPSLADGAFAAMGGLAMSVRDLARLVGMHLSAWPPRDDPDDGPLRRASLREMATVHTIGPTYLRRVSRGTVTDDGYGFGLVTGCHERDGRVVAHSGGLPGFGSHMEWLPDRGVGIVALVNRTYRPVAMTVRKAFDALADAGGLPGRPVGAPSAALLRIRDLVTQLWEEPSSDLLAREVLPTYFLDRDDDRRPPDFEGLRATHGAWRSVGEIEVDGELSGSWTMVCETGALRVTASLGPILPPRLMFLEMKAIEGESRATAMPPA